VLLHVRALRLRIDVTFVRAAMAAMHVGSHRKAIERRRGKHDAYRNGWTGAIRFGIACDRAVAERQLPAEAASRLGLRIRRCAAA